MSDTLPSNADTGSGGGSGLNKKIGGVPLKYILIVGIVVGLGYFLYTRVRGGGTTTASGLPTFTTATGQQGTSTGDVQTAGNGGGGGGGGGSSTSTYTNGQWGLNAANALAGQGQYSPTDISTALNNFLNGVSLTPTQTAIVNAAIAAYGNPPQGVLPATPASTNYTGNGLVSANDVEQVYRTYLNRDASADEQAGWVARGVTYGQLVAEVVASNEYHQLTGTGISGTQLTKVNSLGGTSTHTYTTMPGDTLTSIAARFYNNTDWQKIASANPGYDANSSLPAGTLLTIPA